MARFFSLALSFLDALRIFALLIVLLANTWESRALDLNQPKNTFRFGSAWNYKSYQSQRSKLSAQKNRLAQHLLFHQLYSAGKVVSFGSGVYLGKFNKRDLVLVNHHSVSNSRQCQNSRFQFSIHHKNSNPGTRLIEAQCIRILQTWNGRRDLSLLEIQFSGPRPKLGNLNLWPATKPIPAGTRLFRVGYGIAGKDTKAGLQSPQLKKARVEIGGDCIIFNTLSLNKAAIGCDVSSGDSGSPVFDLSTNSLIGIISSSGDLALKPIFLWSKQGKIKSFEKEWKKNNRQGNYSQELYRYLDADIGDFQRPSTLRNSSQVQNILKKQIRSSGQSSVQSLETEKLQQMPKIDLLNADLRAYFR